MGYKERAQSILSLYGSREKIVLGVTPKDIQRGIEMGFRPFERRMLGMTKQQPDLIRRELEAYREAASKLGNSTSRPATCGSYILEGLAGGTQDFARRFKEAGNMPDFVLWADASHGIVGVVGRIFMAESEIGNISGINETAAGSIDIIEEWRGTPKDMSVKAEHFMGVKADAREAADLLIQDPTGFKLVDEITRQIKERIDLPNRPPKILPYQIPEFVTVGAELAAKAYKAIYPLSSSK